MAKILIIEDNEFVSRMYENILLLERYEVRVANFGIRGLEIARDWKPDLILLDIIMPQTNGIRILQSLKSDSQTQDIPVVMLTVIGEEEVIDRCFKLGASGYLIKPSLNPDQVIAQIKTYLKES